VLEEVRRYAPDLLDRPQIVAATKRDLAGGAADPLEALRLAAAGGGLEVVPVSAVTGEGLDRLKRRLLAMIAASRAVEPQEERA